MYDYHIALGHWVKCICVCYVCVCVCVCACVQEPAKNGERVCFVCCAGCEVRLTNNMNKDNDDENNILKIFKMYGVVRVRKQTRVVL